MTRYKSVANTSVYADIGDLKNKIQKNKKSLKKVLTKVKKGSKIKNVPQERGKKKYIEK